MRHGSARGTTLLDVADLCSGDAVLAPFAEYCRLKELGLRRQALAVVDSYVGTLMADSDAGRRFEIANRLFEIDEAAQIHNLLPHSLITKIMRPACEARISEDQTDPRPYRWLGFQDNWRRALDLDPDDAVARRRWSEALWRDLDYALHELPAGVLDSVENIAESVFDLDQLSQGRGGIAFWRESWLRALACSYLDYARSGERMRFADWAAENGRPESPSESRQKP